MNHNDIHIPHNMRCGKCAHDASDHWASWNGVTVAAGSCFQCLKDQPQTNLGHCTSFVFDNLNYIEVMAERREQEKNLV